jgi:putative nucleotidyltransferase with HDIG domain
MQRRPNGIIGVTRDISDRKRAEEKLQRSYEKLHDTMIATVNTLASTVEMRDPYTAGHQRRVTILACAMAEEMGLTEEQFDGLRMAGLVHDIGKFSVPVEILNKPGRISETEFNIIKAHAQAGYNILKEIEFPWPVAQIVLQHHERLDGSGYPQGLKDGGIMLEAKILAVADVVEAMASHRPYRPALGIEAALEEIAKNQGILYEPEIVDVCQRLFTEKGFTFD